MSISSHKLYMYMRMIKSISPFHTFLKIEIKTEHKFHILKVQTSVIFSIFTKLYSHYYYVIPKHFHAKIEITYPLAVIPFLPSPQVLANTNLVSISMDLYLLDIFILKFLASSFQHNVFKLHPCFRICQKSIYFYG